MTNLLWDSYTLVIRLANNDCSKKGSILKQIPSMPTTPEFSLQKLVGCWNPMVCHDNQPMISMTPTLTNFIIPQENHHCYRWYIFYHSQSWVADGCENPQFLMVISVISHGSHDPNRTFARRGSVQNCTSSCSWKLPRSMDFTLGNFGTWVIKCPHVSHHPTMIGIWCIMATIR